MWLVEMIGGFSSMVMLFYSEKVSKTYETAIIPDLRPSIK